MTNITTRTTIVSNVQLDDKTGYDCWKRKDLSRRRKLESVGAETTSLGSPFQIRGPETLKVRLPTVDSRNIGTTRRLELAERSNDQTNSVKALKEEKCRCYYSVSARTRVCFSAKTLKLVIRN